MRLVFGLLVVAATASGVHAQGIRCSAFLHQSDGSWRAFDDGTVLGPDGPVHIRAGESIRPADHSLKGGVARALNDFCAGD